MKFKQNKIRKLKSVNKVLLSYFLFLAILLILMIEIICYIIVSNAIESQARDRLTFLGREISVIVRTEDLNYVTKYIYSQRQEGINIIITDRYGDVVLPMSDNTDDFYIDPEVIKLFGVIEEEGSVTCLIDSNLTHIRAVGKSGEGYIVVTFPMSIYNGVKRIMLLYFIMVGAVVIMITSLISYGISQKLSGGLRNLSATAVKFADGQYDVDFANAEYQELADLSDTLNTVRDEVKKSGDFQREILANVSHDLKTPLTMIKAYASMIKEISGDNPEKRNKHLQVIIDEADRLTGLVNDVLNVSKVNSKLSEINFKVFNLTEFIYGIINKFEYLQETQGYKFMVDIDANMYTRADSEKIGQVIYNLLGNAVNYTGEDKTVFISLKSDYSGERIKFSVRDTGKGIAPQDIPEIWNRYYRANETHARPVKGSGLGLNIVKIILQNHSFDFGVQSEVGKGSLFWVDFPSVPSEIDDNED